MRGILIMAVGLLFCAPVGVGYENTPGFPHFQNDVVEHGGGCRKSSPPGQCCHMNRKTGVVHCH